MADTTPFPSLLRPFLDLGCLWVFMDLPDIIGPNNCNAKGISQLKMVIFVHFVDRSFLAVHQPISESGYGMKDLKECRPKRLKQ